MSIIHSEIQKLPIDIREVVSHYVLAAAETNDLERAAMANERHRVSSISTVTVIFGAFGVALGLMGLYLATVAPSSGINKINLFGNSIETSSVGVACVVAAAIVLVLCFKSAMKRI